MTSPANASDLFKTEIQQIVNGVSTLFVGSDQFPTIDSALTHILNNTPAKTEFGQVYGGTVTLAQYDDVVTFASMSVIFNQFGQADAVTFPCWIEFNGDGQLYLVDKLLGGASLRIMAGYKEASLSGSTYKLFRLPSWSIFVGPGFHEINGDYNLATIEACVSINGAGKLVSSIQEVISGGNAFGINPPLYGSFELNNLSINGSALSVLLDGAAIAFNNNFGLMLSMVNVYLTKNDILAGTDVVNLGAAYAFLDGVEIAGVGDVYIIICDRLRANNIHINSELMGLNGFAFRCWDYQCTKRWTLNNIYAHATSGTGGIWFLKATTDTNISKELLIQGCECQSKITVRNDSGTINKFIAYSKNNTLLSFESDGATIESTNDSKLDGSALDAPTLLNSGVVN